MLQQTRYIIRFKEDVVLGEEFDSYNCHSGEFLGQGDGYRSTNNLESIYSSLWEDTAENRLKKTHSLMNGVRMRAGAKRIKDPLDVFELIKVSYVVTQIA